MNVSGIVYKCENVTILLNYKSLVYNVACHLPQTNFFLNDFSTVHFKDRHRTLTRTLYSLQNSEFIVKFGLLAPVLRDYFCENQARLNFTLKLLCEGRIVALW